MLDITHPWRVAVYNEGSTHPIRTFDHYKTQEDAQEFADHLQAQAKQNGWSYKVRVECVSS